VIQTKNSKLDKSLCRHAYHSAVESLARLSCYATSRNLIAIGHGEYYAVAEELFKKDILEIAISIRRLSELTGTQSVLKSTNMKVVQKDKETEIARKSDSLWNIIGNIIHGVQIDVVKSIGFMEYLDGKNTDLLKAIENKDEVDAMITIKSDKFSLKAFNSVEFCAKINIALDHINDHMADNGLFLGGAYE
jgi:hypothetical protein